MSRPALPWCAVCQKPIDELVEMEAAAANNGRGARIWIARCHGDEQRAQLSDDDLLEADPRSLRFAVAFQVAAMRETA